MNWYEIQESMPSWIISELSVVVGGLLAKYEFDFLSQTDPFFTNPSGQALLASEVKTAGALNVDSMWYQGSKGPQVLAALYGHSCPTILLSQRYWKIFIEAPNRDGLLTFPFGRNPGRAPHINASCFHEMGHEFVEAIAICLLSTRAPLLPSTPISSDPLPAERVQGAGPRELPEFAANKGFRSAERSTERRMSLRLRKLPPLSYDSSAEQRPISRVLTGHDDADQPIYSPVRVASPEKVARMVEEIAKRELQRAQEEEKKETRRQGSEATLFEIQED
jgi:hypothetical protein